MGIILPTEQSIGTIRINVAMSYNAATNSQTQTHIDLDIWATAHYVFV